MNARCALPAPFANAAGLIQNLTEDVDIRGAAIITTGPRRWRSSHYHKTDAHYLYVVSGFCNYYERPVGAEPGSEQGRCFVRGDMFYTPAMVEHLVVNHDIQHDLVMVSLSLRGRDRASHEEDVVRVPIQSWRPGMVGTLREGGLVL